MDYSVAADQQIAGDLGDKLKEVTSGCRLEVSAFTCMRKMTPEQRQRMANAFSADVGSVTGGREIINRRLPVVKPLFSAISKARLLWRDHTIKYEDGVRLIRTDRIAWMNAQIGACQQEARAAAEDVHAAWETVKEDAKTRLQDLYNELDYAFDVRNAFGMTISYPAIEPDSRLKTIAPELYEAERKKIAASFEEAAIVAEEGLRSEFQELLSGLMEKLSDQESEDGKKRHVKQQGIDALVSFAERFKSMAIGSNAELEGLVEQAKALAGNTTVKGLREGTAKQEFKQSLQEVSALMDAFIEKSPIRKFDLD